MLKMTGGRILSWKILTSFKIINPLFFFWTRFSFLKKRVRGKADGNYVSITEN